MPRKMTVCDIDRLEMLVAEQKTNKEIAQIMGVNERLVRIWVERHGLTGKRRAYKEQEQTGPNRDRHLCVTCKYRHDGAKGCDYILKTGRPRGCDAAECNVYEKRRNEDRIIE